MKKVYFLLVGMFLFINGFSQLLTFDFAGLAGDEVSAGSGTNATGVLASTITRGSGVNASGNADRFNSNQWTTSASVDANDYLEFTITPDGGYLLTITSIDIQHMRSGTGPVSFVVRTSLDSYAADATNVVTVADVTTSLSSTFTFTSSINTSVPVTIRLYGYAAEGSTGSWGPGDSAGDDIVVNGSAATGGCSGVPTTPASFGTITPASTSAEINVNAGDGYGRIIKVNTTNSFTAYTSGDPVPSANTVYGGGEQVVFAGAGTSVTVTGLAASTIYYVAVYEYCNNGPEYTTAATTSFMTNAAPSLGLQLTTINTGVLIDFDNTLANVNEGQYAGSGFTTSPASGQLNSNTWATTGMSDGASAFGASSTTGDFARGSSSGGVTTGGFYAFETSTGNRGFGVQPIGSDWGTTPGTLTLRVQNSTGVLLNSVDVEYLIWILNDQGRSNSFNFSYSTDNINYTAVGALDYASPEAADGSPAWASVPRSTSLPLIVPAGGYFYLRWTSGDVSGAGSRDEFALDDIEITGNATQIPTPVKFSNVKAYAEGNGIRIDWSNLTETDVNNYTVERSASSQFADLGSVNASRNDGGKASYTYLDAAPLSGISFYRIRSEEYNGKVLYSAIVKVDTRGGATDVVLYPNPTNGGVISMQATALNKGLYTIQVFNTSGQRVLTQSLNHPGGFVTQTIQLPALQPGLYSLQLSGGATRISKSFIVR